MEGYYTGIFDLYGAEMDTEETATTAPVYGDPFVIGKSIEVSITPSYKEGKMDASNVTTRNKKLVDTYALKANVDKILAEARDRILGRFKDSNGVQVIKGNTEPPKLAVGFALTLDDGSKELWWLYKGTFAELTMTGKTEVQGSIDYQTPTIEGVFVRRMNDNALAAVVATADEGIKPSVAEGWFAAVYEPASEAVKP